jgi:hypothetical protein
MSVGLADKAMTRRNDLTVKIDAEVLRMAKVVASFKDISLAEYLTEALRPIVERDLKEHSRKALGEDPKPDPGPKPKRGDR